MAFGKLGARGGFGFLGGGSGKATGGPFLLLVDGVSKLLLQNGVDRLLITGAAPAGPLSGQPIGLLVSLTYP